MIRDDLLDELMTKFEEELDGLSTSGLERLLEISEESSLIANILREEEFEEILSAYDEDDVEGELDELSLIDENEEMQEDDYNKD